MSIRLLFVCLGNICRSPTAEGVMADLIRREGMQDQVEVDSAGTGGWHVGSPPDSRATSTAAARGIPLQGAARQITAADLSDFDLILAMDRSNLADIRRLASDERQRAKVRLLREFDPNADEEPEVPDPYYGAAGGFEEVLDLVGAACEGLLAQIKSGQIP